MSMLVTALRSRTALAALALVSAGCATSGPVDRWVGYPPGVDSMSEATTASVAPAVPITRGPVVEQAMDVCERRREGDSCTLQADGASFDGACKMERSDLGMGRLECEPGQPKRLSSVVDAEEKNDKR